MTQMQTNLERMPSSLYAILLTFTWGNSNVARYCKWTHDLNVNGQDFTAEPSISVAANEQHGGTSDSPMQITAKYIREPFASLARMELMANVDVRVQVVRVGDESTMQDWFYGTVSKSLTAPSGVAGLVKLTVAGLKHRLALTTLGMQATTTCQSAYFGDLLCTKDVDALKITANITEIDSTYPDIIRTDAAGDLANERWKWGTVRFDGLEITIRASLEEGSFQLRDNPPSSWVDALATFTPGCDRQIASCRYWDNEARFTGVGYAMPDKNPMFQLR